MSLRHALRGISARARVAVAAGLEMPSPSSGRWRAGLSQAWAQLAGASRRIRLPNGVRVVGVGGATLGGSGRTPITRAVAETLAAQGARVVVVGHGYGASRTVPGIVSASDRCDEVGDEAWMLARQLPSVPVVVGGSRQRAMELAATLGDVLVVDGLLQAAPERLTLSVLAVDAQRPWGAGACPPLGDLRALPATLLAAADCVIALGTGHAVDSAAHPSWYQAHTSHCLSEPVAKGHTIALFVSVARPERVVRALGHLGVVPELVVRAPDHRPTAVASSAAATEAAQRRSQPLQWIVTEKCLAGLGGNLAAHAIFGADPIILRQSVRLPEEVRVRLHHLHCVVP